MQSPGEERSHSVIMTPRNMFQLFLISLNILFAGLSLALLSPFYPGEALSKGVSVTQSGLVLGSVFITTVIGIKDIQLYYKGGF